MIFQYKAGTPAVGNTPAVLGVWTIYAGDLPLSGLDLRYQRTSSSALAFASTVSVDFAGDPFRTLALTANTTLASANLSPGRRAEVRVSATFNSFSVTMPAAWKVVGAGVPGTIGQGKCALLRLMSWGTADADVTAEYLAQP